MSLYIMFGLEVLDSFHFLFLITCSGEAEAIDYCDSYKWTINVDLLLPLSLLLWSSVLTGCL